VRSHTATVLALCMAALAVPSLEAQARTAAIGEPARAGEARLYARAVAREYDVAGRELDVLGAWVDHPAELPVLLFIANRAGVTADVVGSLRRSGQSWQRIALRFGLGPATFRVPVGDAVVSGVLARPVREFAKPAGRWHQIAMTDMEIIALVNLRMLSNQLRASPEEVLPQMRGLSPDFIGAYARVEDARAQPPPP